MEKNEEKNILILFNSLKEHFYELSLHMYGCRVIQKLLDFIHCKNISEIFQELKIHFTKCIKSQNGMEKQKNIIMVN